jgi:hypothetical protein
MGTGAPVPRAAASPLIVMDVKAEQATSEAEAIRMARGSAELEAEPGS